MKYGNWLVATGLSKNTWERDDFSASNYFGLQLSKKMVQLGFYERNNIRPTTSGGRDLTFPVTTKVFSFP